MKRIFVFGILLLFTFIAFSQKTIEAPKVSFAETKEDFENLVTIHLSADEQLSINKKAINSFEHLKLEMISLISYQMKNKQMDYSLMIIELNIDKKCSLKRVTELLEKLRDYSFETFFLTSETESLIRIEGTRSIGFHFSFPEKEKLEFNIRRHVQKILNIPPPPPPPPPYWKKTWEYLPETLYNVNTYKNNEGILKLYDITIENDSLLTVSDEMVKGLKNIERKFKTLVSNELAVFQIHFKEGVTYESFAKIISLIKEPIFEQRNETSIKLYELDYNELGFHEKATVADFHPDIILIKE